jgi:hypothetical protein
LGSVDRIGANCTDKCRDRSISPCFIGEGSVVQGWRWAAIDVLIYMNSAQTYD